MTNFFALLVIMTLSLFSLAVAQSVTDKKDAGVVKITNTQQFQIRYYSRPGTDNLDLKIDYTNEKSKIPYTITVNKDTSNKIELDEPLNMLYFKNKLNAVLNKPNSNTYQLHDSSFEEIYRWVFSINKFGAEAPMSGRLILNSYIYVVQKNERGTHRSRTFDVMSLTTGIQMAIENEEREFRQVDNPYLWMRMNLPYDRKLSKTAKITRLENEYKRLETEYRRGLASEAMNFPKDAPQDSVVVTDTRRFEVRILQRALGDTLTSKQSLLKPYISAKAALDSTYTLMKQKGIFPIKKLSIQIERGFIERIQVWIVDDLGKEVIYENIYAIGFSSVKNFKFFSETKLVPRYGRDGSAIYLSDVFANYDNYLSNYTRDYSPADTTINEFKPENGWIDLKRDELVNLFDTKIYTDLNGLKPNSPNGLVQIEVNRRFNIKTSRTQLGSMRSDIGWLGYFNAFGSYNKVENEQRYLPLRNQNVGQNGELLSPSYATNLDFRQYETFSLGGELNSFLFDWPDGKLTAFIDLGAKYGQTPVVDKVRLIEGSQVTVTDDTLTFSAHTATWYPKVSIELFSEKRVGFIMSYQYNTTHLFSNNNFKQITSYAKSNLLDRTLERSARRSHVVEIYLRAEPTLNRNGRVFFKARYFIQQRDMNTFFAQFQLGYSYNLVFKK